MTETLLILLVILILTRWIYVLSKEVQRLQAALVQLQQGCLLLSQGAKASAEVQGQHLALFRAHMENHLSAEEATKEPTC